MPTPRIIEDTVTISREDLQGIEFVRSSNTLSRCPVCAGWVYTYEEMSASFKAHKHWRDCWIRDALYGDGDEQK